ncbi:four helix bundle protein [Agarivorans aestuarii]|uniref:Four helix bundle protein n=1 Tax=Agarivorans aestuarii TaxID=1563703 RepID=A0ABU7G0S1_9ALTE|nr:four helix bundle protein [Agarivorans aestuarii]MEE1672821.1 four helix bundle protein [Agarivorans aestuarii]
MDFERLVVWQRAVDLSVQIYTHFGDSKDFGFKDQITRSSLSIPSNIAEGMARRSDKEKLNFINIAQGSCAELRTQIFIGIRINYIPDELGNVWIQETRELGSMLFGLANSI